MSTSGNDSYETPMPLFNRLDQLFGFTWDLAARFVHAPACGCKACQEGKGDRPKGGTIIAIWHPFKRQAPAPHDTHGWWYE